MSPCRCRMRITLVSPKPWQSVWPPHVCWARKSWKRSLGLSLTAFSSGTLSEPRVCFLLHSFDPVVTDRCHKMALWLSLTLELLGPPWSQLWTWHMEWKRPMVPALISLAPVMATWTEPEPLQGWHSLWKMPLVTQGLSLGCTLYRCRSHLKPLPGTSFFKTNKSWNIIN